MKGWTTMTEVGKVRWRLSSLLGAASLRSVRLAIALGSLLWTLMLFWGSGLISPEVHLFDPKRTTYRLMAQVMEEEWWSVAFFIHFCTACYTLMREKYTRMTFFLDPLYGSFLWTFCTVACFASHWTKLTSYAPPAAMSAEVALMFACWWYLIRWGPGSE